MGESVGVVLAACWQRSDKFFLHLLIIIISSSSSSSVCV